MPHKPQESLSVNIVLPTDREDASALYSFVKASTLRLSFAQVLNSSYHDSCYLRTCPIEGILCRMDIRF